MKTIIAGSRYINDYDLVKKIIEDSNFIITEVVSGHAKGVDSLGERWAKENGIPIKRFIPKWDEHGIVAGLVRNTQMAEYADALIAVWFNKSSGTADMIRKSKNLTTYIVEVTTPNIQSSTHKK